MNSTPLPSTSERISALPTATAPPTLGQRVWKGFGGTPWWRLVVGGLIVLISVALFTVPFESRRLERALKSAAARQEFKLAVQKQVLERARSGLLGFRSLANDPSAVKEIGDAIGDIERELAAPKHDVVVKNVAELTALIDAQRDEIKKSSRALEQAAGKLRGTADAPDATDNIELLATKLEALQESVSQLQEMQSRAGEFDEDTSGKNDKTITFSLFGKKAQAVINLSDRPVADASSLDPKTR